MFVEQTGNLVRHNRLQIMIICYYWPYFRF